MRIAHAEVSLVGAEAIEDVVTKLRKPSLFFLKDILPRGGGDGFRHPGYPRCVRAAVAPAQVVASIRGDIARHLEVVFPVANRGLQLPFVLPASVAKGQGPQ